MAPMLSFICPKGFQHLHGNVVDGVALLFRPLLYA